ncbi:hypothetical protein ACFOE1_09885 [Agromyces mediolanus]|uniref:Uncharacterized protein n=1 Tax=Agromyces mediolanus TaxID=41986 RepID=A0A918FA52_AGRME|nr:hypothetical protein [Agromyces mediolanus]GGR20156.1 hypothetical protein GCM10010196_11770 [Agromyces mediolanus]GLJ73180.1 hypothetical protein GCM10017583_24380 [Agromyces mediolanus]
MTVVATATAERELGPPRLRVGEVWRIVRLLAVNPTIFFGVPWMILGGAWAVTMVIALIMSGAGAPMDEAREGFRYSWAVLSPQWYLVVVGVQAVAYTFSFALGFGSTRRDFWLGMSVIFVLVSAEMAVAIATLVQLEQLTNGWWIGAGMFDALWYGQLGWGFDFFSTFVLQLLVLFIGASATTIYMRWRVRGMMVLLFSTVALVLILIATLTFTESWPAVWTWLVGLTPIGLTLLGLAAAAVAAVAGFLVIRRATPR